MFVDSLALFLESKDVRASISPWILVGREKIAAFLFSWFSHQMGVLHISIRRVIHHLSSREQVNVGVRREGGL